MGKYPITNLYERFPNYYLKAVCLLSTHKHIALLQMTDKIKYLRRSGSPVAQRVKRLPEMWETRVRSIGWEDPLEKEMATHSSTLA